MELSRGLPLPPLFAIDAVVRKLANDLAVLPPGAVGMEPDADAIVVAQDEPSRRMMS